MSDFIGVGSFQWMQHNWKQGKSLNDNLDEALGAVKAAGFRTWEPSLETNEATDALYEALQRHELQCPSAYLGGSYHQESWQAEVDAALATAEHGAKLGLQIIVLNPNPIDWNSPQDKSDEELRTQAKALRTLTLGLKDLGMDLAYHMHTPELRQGARELHHMMLATEEAGMGMCLDAHWIYRACGNSQVAVEDIIRLYGRRIISTHLRQSKDGVWLASLGEGDLDYGVIFSLLKEAGFSGPHICESAYEEGTPEDVPLAEATKISADWLLDMASR